MLQCKISGRLLVCLHRLRCTHFSSVGHVPLRLTRPFSALHRYTGYNLHLKKAVHQVTRPQSSKQARTPGMRYLIAVGKGSAAAVAILIVYAYVQGKELRQRLEQKKRKDLKTYVDPHIKGSAKTLALRNGCWLPTVLFPNDNVLDAIWNFPMRNDDVLVVSFPKSGTTWVQEIVYLVKNNVDFTKARTQLMEQRFPYLEYVYPGLNVIHLMKSPRLLKSHLPYYHLPNDITHGKGKVIYIARNPKDVAVSYYYFMRMLSEVSYTGTLDEFVEAFVSGTVPYGPWVIHIQEFLEDQPKKSNLLVITYEDLHEDPEAVIEKIAIFLGHKLTKKQVSQIAEFTSFHNMKSNPASNYSWWDELGLRKKGESDFMRKGMVGDWQNHLTKQSIDKINQMSDSWLKNVKKFRDR